MVRICRDCGQSFEYESIGHICENSSYPDGVCRFCELCPQCRLLRETEQK